MTDARRYDAFLTRPAAGSKYEFLLMGLALTGDEPAPPSWLFPVEITNDMSPEVAAYWRRWNEQQAPGFSVLKAAAVQSLREGGMPQELLTEPLNDEIERLVHKLTSGMQACMAMKDQQAAPAHPSSDVSRGMYERSVCNRVVLATNLSVKGRSLKGTAEFLNDGRAIGATGLDRCHVGRAIKAEEKRLLPLMWKQGAACLVDTYLDTVHLASLNLVHKQARKRKEFQRLGGARLAVAIHNDWDLRERMRRAGELLYPAA